MAALTGPRGLFQQNADFTEKVPVKAGVVIYDGAAICMEGGYATPARAAAALTTIGVADLTHWSDVTASGQAPVLVNTSNTKVDNTAGANAARYIVVRTGVFMFDNKAGDLLAATDVGLDCYWEDDHTVRKTAAGSSVAGKVMGMDSKTGLPMVLLFTAGRAI